MFKVKTNKSVLKVIEREPLASGASKIYGVTFTFDSEWDGLVKTAIFKAGEISISVLIEKDYCDVPWEVLARENSNEFLWIGVFGADKTGIILPTIWNQLGVIQPGAELSESGKNPTPAVVAQIYAAAKGAEEKADQAALLAARAQIYAEEAKGYADQTENILTEVTNTSDAILTVHSMTQSEADRAEEAADRASATVNGMASKNDVPNAVKGNLLGTTVTAADVSPIEHDLKIKVSSKNLYRNMKAVNNTANIPGITISGLLNDSSIIVNGKSTLDNIKGFQGPSFVLDPGEYTFSINENIFQDIGVKGDASRIHINGTVNDGAPVLAYYYFSGSQRRTSFTITEPTSVFFSLLVTNAVEFSNTVITLMLEKGTAASEYAPYVDPTGVNVALTDGENQQTAASDADGNVNGLVSLAPSMTLTSDTENIIIECEYNRDLMKVIETLTQAIISLGGNI